MKFPEVDKEHYPPIADGRDFFQGVADMQVENGRLKEEVEGLRQSFKLFADQSVSKALADNQKARIEQLEAALASWEAKATEYANEINNLREQLMVNTAPAVSGDDFIRKAVTFGD